MTTESLVVSSSNHEQAPSSFDRLRTSGAVALALLAGLLVAAYLADPLQEGLNATFFGDANWRTDIVRSEVDRRVSTDSAFAGWRGTPPDTFSVTWSGAFLASRDGTYTFATASDDGSWVYVDRQLVVDNGGSHARQLAKGSVRLTRGVHAIYVKYFQSGGPFDLEVMWARGDAPLERIPAWALAPRFVSFGRFLTSVIVRRAVRWAFWFGLAGAIVALLVVVWRAAARFAAAPSLPSTDACLLVLGLLMLLLVLPHEVESDGRIRYFALGALVEWRDVSVTPYSLVGPLFSAPLYFLGKVFPPTDWWCARFNAVVFIAGIGVAYRLLRPRVDAAVLARFLLLLTAASMFPHHLEGYFAEVFTAVLVALGLAAVAAGYSFRGWTAAIVGVVNAPATVVALAASALQHIWETRRLRYVLPVVVAVAAIALESWIRRGSPFASGYGGNHGGATVLPYSGRPGFSYPMFFGLLSILFSFGKGILFYAPGLVLWIRNRQPFVNDFVLRCYRLWMAFLVGLILVYAKWWAWWGGWFWGPRFFLFASFPACFGLAVALAGRRRSTLTALLVLFAVLSLSTWVAIEGVVFEPSWPDVCFDQNIEPLCWYVPEFSPLWRPFVSFTRPTIDRAALGVYFCVVYAWLAAPLVADIFRATRAVASEFISTHVRLPSWRI
jgi:fibro-slime domain-containing protein